MLWTTEKWLNFTFLFCDIGWLSSCFNNLPKSLYNYAVKKVHIFKDHWYDVLKLTPNKDSKKSNLLHRAFLRDKVSFQTDVILLSIEVRVSLSNFKKVVQGATIVCSSPLLRSYVVEGRNTVEHTVVAPCSVFSLYKFGHKFWRNNEWKFNEI